MENRTRRLLAITAGLATSLGLSAQDAAAAFAKPVRIKIGADYLASQRQIPSPVFHDVDGDGRLDVVIGDLLGGVTVATQTAAAGLLFANEVPLRTVKRKPLRFHNW